MDEYESSGGYYQLYDPSCGEGVPLGDFERICEMGRCVPSDDPLFLYDKFGYGLVDPEFGYLLLPGPDTRTPRKIQDHRMRVAPGVFLECHIRGPEVELPPFRLEELRVDPADRDSVFLAYGWLDGEGNVAGLDQDLRRAYGEHGLSLAYEVVGYLGERLIPLRAFLIEEVLEDLL